MWERYRRRNWRRNWQKCCKRNVLQNFSCVLQHVFFEADCRVRFYHMIKSAMIVIRKAANRNIAT